MPGLLRAVAATAVISGTATATRNAVNRKQADKNVAAYSEAVQHSAPPPQQAPPQQAPPPQKPAAAPPENDLFTQLERLGALHDKGILTDEEFSAEKAKLLGT